MTFLISQGYVIGIDLGGSNVRAALFDDAGNSVAEAAEPTVAGDASAVVAQLGDVGRRLVHSAGLGWQAVAGVGVGVAGVVADGTLRMAPNLPWFGDVDVLTALARELSGDVVVDNDVNMATLGEQRRGLGNGIDDFVFIGVGTGVGMGIVAGGRLLRGAHGAAGEIGEMPFEDGARRRAGETLEEVAGGAGVARRYAERTQRAEPLTAADVYAAADAGEPAAVELLEEQSAALARAVVTVHSVLDPELIVLGGGIGRRDDFAARVRGHVDRIASGRVRLEPSALGKAAGVIGAAEAARRLVGEQVDA
jgi:glucokinase